MSRLDFDKSNPDVGGEIARSVQEMMDVGMDHVLTLLGIVKSLETLPTSGLSPERIATVFGVYTGLEHFYTQALKRTNEGLKSLAALYGLPYEKPHDASEAFLLTLRFRAAVEDRIRAEKAQRPSEPVAVSDR